MPEKELPYGIIAIIVLFVVVIGVSQLFLKETRGLSKENFECKYLSLLPSFCTDADKQKIAEQNKQAQINEMNIFLDKIVSTFRTCGENSQQQICKCSLEFSKLLDSSTFIGKQQDGFIYIKNYQTNYEKKIEGLTEININNKQNKLVSINSLYNSNFIIFNTYDKLGVRGTNVFAHKYLQINTDSPPKTIVQFEKQEDMNKIAVFKQDNKRGIYLPYSNSNLRINHECEKCGTGIINICDKAECQKIAEATNAPCYYIDNFGYASPGGTCHGDSTKSYEYELGNQNLVSNGINIPDC